MQRLKNPDFLDSYGHLEKIAKDLPFHKPIKKGEVIGYSGDSGLTWGYQEFPQRPDPKDFPSWDETHLHFQVFTKVGSKGNKKYFDPYGIKSDFKDYPDSGRLINRKNLGAKSSVLWILNEEKMPMFSE